MGSQKSKLQKSKLQEPKLLSSLPLEIRFRIFELLLCSPHLIISYSAEVLLKDSLTFILPESSKGKRGKRKQEHSVIGKEYPRPFTCLGLIPEDEEDPCIFRGPNSFGQPVIYGRQRSLLQTTISNKTNERGPLCSLSASCSQLRREVSKWAQTKRTNIINSRSFGLVHKDKTRFLFAFTDYPDHGHLHTCMKPWSLAQVELFGLWMEAMRRSRSTDMKKCWNGLYNGSGEYSGQRVKVVMKMITQEVEGDARLGTLAKCEHEEGFECSCYDSWFKAAIRA